MFETFRNAWKIEDLRKRLMYTLLILVLFRVGCAITVPYINPAVLSTFFSGTEMLGYLNMMSGGALSQCAVFALGVSPYINASIIIQLLTVAIPALENLAKEGEEGRRKITRITHYTAMGIAFVMSIGYYFILRRMGALHYTSGWESWASAVVIILTFTAGSQLITWMGEQIDSKGIGNGVSLLIFAGIISNLFNGITGNIYTAVANGTTTAWLSVLVILLMLVVMTFAVTYVDLGERRIPLQISKQVKGRRVYGGQNTHMTLKVVSVGVLPLIFAYSLLAFPGTIGALVAPNSGFTAWCNAYLSSGSWVYMILSALLIVGFTFFYSSISFDPNKQAKQLMEQGATIPGQRGKNIRDYLARTTNRLNLFAALFLAVLAVIPTLLTSWVTNLPFAASSILIAVSVSLETMRTVEGELSIRGIETDKDNGFM